MSSRLQNSREVKNRLIFIIAAIAAILLIVLAFVIHRSNKENQEQWIIQLLENLIPNLLSSIIAFIIIYLLFTSKGIELSDSSKTDSDSDFYNKLDLIDSKLDKIASKNINSETPNWLVNGFVSYEEIPWDNYVKESASITFVAFYCDNWLVKYRELIRNTLKKENASFTLILPDYTDDNLMNRIYQIIPRHSKEKLVERIKRSISLSNSIRKSEKSFDGRIKIILYKNVFSYTMQIFDKRHVFVSINEMYRDGNYNSPFILLDMASNMKIRELFEMEQDKLTKDSTRVDLTRW